MKNFKVYLAGVLAVGIGIGVVSYCNSQLVENSQKSELEQQIEEFQEMPYLKLNTDSPVGVIVTYEPETTENYTIDETDSYFHHK